MPNHLAQETSPYLQQHADNPVDWYAWKENTLRIAREQDKPILLSIGYSACHWCHVMAHESFEDTEVAAIMNRYFINIKVDREERPDLDQIYQSAHYLLTQRNGGWPLTMFLSPDGTPFFGGTYFPKQARYHLPGFTDLLERVAKFYMENRSELDEQGQKIITALASNQPQATHDVQLHTAPLAAAVINLKENFDAVTGGFGRAPKFLHPAELDFLLRQGQDTADNEDPHIVLFTLRQMARGGLYDQLGGGFCRYSVDERWDIPHFEKMLYDNGQLLSLFCDAWQCSGDVFYAGIVEQTAAWIMREMQAPDGGYYSSLDADSEHEEGKFYVWQREEVRKLLSAEEFAVFAPYYGLNQPPNFEKHAWNLRISKQLAEIGATLKLDFEQAHALLSSAQQKMFIARTQRIRPARDEKILAAWNGLMIAGMARAARVFRRADWLLSAQRSMDFVRTTLWNNGKLLATCKDGKAHLNAYLDDHAFLLNAALELLQAEYRASDMAFAVQIADAMLSRFEDPQQGGFFFTSHDHEALIQRSKVAQDNATPSGNGMAAQALQRLSLLSGNMEYAAAAEHCLKLFLPALEQAGAYHCSLGNALAEYMQPASLLVLRGNHDEMSIWQKSLQAHYLPHLIIIAIAAEVTDLPESLNKPLTEKTCAWLCHGTQCLPPITTLGELLEQMQINVAAS
jgi:uncharacterized protein YyaL (SSP411 family)